MILTGPPFLVLGEVLAGVRAAINHRRYNNQINQTLMLARTTKRNIASMLKNGGKKEMRVTPLIMSLRGALTCALKRCRVGTTEHARNRSDWSRAGSGSVSSPSSSICEPTVHNSKHLLSFIKSSLRCPRHSLPQWALHGVRVLVYPGPRSGRPPSTMKWHLETYESPGHLALYTNGETQLCKMQTLGNIWTIAKQILRESWFMKGQLHAGYKMQLV